MNNTNKKIDTNLELQHLIEYIKNNWENVPHLEEIVTLAWETSLEKTKNMFDKHGMLDITSEIITKREDPKLWNNLPKKELELISTYDAIHNIGYQLLLGPSTLDKIVTKNWNYENICNEIELSIKEKYDVTKFKPYGWAKLNKTYSDFDGMKEFDQKTTNSKFKGIDSSSASSSGFHVRVALPQVMYDSQAQGRKPINTLIGAILGHAYAVSSQNNTLDILKDVKKIKDYYLTPQFFNKIELNIDVSQFVESKLLEAIFKLRKEEPISQEQYNNEVKKHYEYNFKFEKLSPEDKKSELEKRDQELMNELHIELRNKDKDIDKIKIKEKEQYDLCMAILNETPKINKKSKPL